MLNIFDKKLLAWISSNKTTFFLVILLLGNIYQYIDGRELQKAKAASEQAWAQKVEELNKQSIEYERIRSEKLEFLLSNLAKTQPDASTNTQKNGNR